MNEVWIAELGRSLPDHAAVVAKLAAAVESVDCWRALVVGCSLGAGRGDRLSDVDAGVAYAESLPAGDLDASGLALIRSAGPVIDVLVHRYPGWPDDSRRFAVEYDTGVQLDVTTWRRPWRRTRVTDIPIVDKDGDLAMLDEPPANVIEDRLRREAREWVMLAWWAVSDVAKYLQRGSLFEAADRITAARDWALRLFAAANRIPDAGYGLSSLLDHEPHALPAQLAETYCLPPDPDAVASAARAVVALLHDCADRAQATIGVDLTTPWSATAARRLEATGAAPP